MAFHESRVLVAASAAVDQVRRFAHLDKHRDAHLKTIRRAVLDMYATEAWLPGRVLVDKEPLEPVAFPHGAYDGFLRNYLDLFPDSRLVILVRHPLATCWSMVNRTWGHSLVDRRDDVLTIEDAIDIWRANARIAAERAADERVLICRFEQLVTDPGGTTRELASHTGITERTPFTPKPTKTVDFSDADSARILEATRAERELLGYEERAPV